MLNYLIMCRSLTYAQKAAKALERAGMTATVSRPPAEVSGEGCTYSVKVSERSLPAALVVLKNAGVPSGKIYMMDMDGHPSEVMR